MRAALLPQSLCTQQQRVGRSRLGWLCQSFGALWSRHRDGLCCCTSHPALMAAVCPNPPQFWDLTTSWEHTALLVPEVQPASRTGTPAGLRTTSRPQKCFFRTVFIAPKRSSRVFGEGCVLRCPHSASGSWPPAPRQAGRPGCTAAAGR